MYALCYGKLCFKIKIPCMYLNVIIIIKYKINIKENRNFIVDTFYYYILFVCDLKETVPS